MFSVGPRTKQLKRLSAVAVSGLLYFPFVAFAQTTSTATPTKLESGLQAVLNLLTGPVARSLAILAAVAFGIGALSGRVDWIKAVTVILGIGVVFSAETLMKLFFNV